MDSKNSWKFTRSCDKWLTEASVTVSWGSCTRWVYKNQWVVDVVSAAQTCCCCRRPSQPGQPQNSPSTPSPFAPSLPESQPDTVKHITRALLSVNDVDEMAWVGLLVTSLSLPGWVTIFVQPWSTQPSIHPEQANWVLANPAGVKAVLKTKICILNDMPINNSNSQNLRSQTWSEILF